MTKRQRDVYLFIRNYWAQHGCSPSYDDMLAGLNMSSRGGLAAALQRLVDRGFIARSRYCARSIEIVREPVIIHQMQPGDIGL